MERAGRRVGPSLRRVFSPWRSCGQLALSVVIAVAAADLVLFGSRLLPVFVGGTSAGATSRAGGSQTGASTARRSAGEIYEVLGVSKDATVMEIKKAYYNAAKDCHPDKFPGDEAIAARFQSVAEAYSTLADPVRRNAYDLRGLAGLAFYKTDATRLFGPPPWRVLIARTNHWMWEPEKKDYMIGLMASSIPNGISGVTMKSITAAYDEAYSTTVAVLMDRVTEEQAKDTVDQIEEYGLMVKAEPIEGERQNEKETPIMYFRRMQRELGEASENLRTSSIDLDPRATATTEDFTAEDKKFESWVDLTRSLRSELRAAAKGLEEFKMSQVEK